MKLLQTEEPCK